LDKLRSPAFALLPGVLVAIRLFLSPFAGSLYA
jgi:hypothetical protein